MISLRTAGHYADVKLMKPPEMRQMMVDEARRLHKKKHESDPDAPRFEPATVDVSAVREGSLYYGGVYVMFGPYRNAGQL